MSYSIWVGKNLMDDGRACLAGYGDEPSSHWLELIEGQRHGSDAWIEVGMSEDGLMPGVRTLIKQAPLTARHLRVSYSCYEGVPAPLTNGGLNEHGVAVRDVWSPSNELLCKMTSARQTGPNYSDLARLVLERATSARGGVELIGDLIAGHGYSTYGGNSHMVADEDEAWLVIEFAGSAGLWVAQRMGPDDIRVSRPGYIEEIPDDFRSHPDFMGPTHLIDFAIDQGWHQLSDGAAFNVNQVYGDGRGRWDGVRWIEGEMRERASRSGKLALSDVMWAVRTERLTGETAGYGQVVQLGSVSSPEERHLWHAPVGALAAPFTPFFLGVDALPIEFGKHRYLTVDEPAKFADNTTKPDMGSTVGQRVEATTYAYHVFSRLLLLLCEHHELFLPEVTPVWEAFEASMIAELPGIMEQARVLRAAGMPHQSRELLTRHCSARAQSSLALGEAMLESMDQRSRVLFGIRTDLEWRGPAQIW